MSDMSKSYQFQLITSSTRGASHNIRFNKRTGYWSIEFPQIVVGGSPFTKRKYLTFHQAFLDNAFEQATKWILQHRDVNGSLLNK